MEQTAASRLQEHVEIIRPAAVLESRVATQVLNHLREQDVSLGGVWNASASVWQRYDQPWNGVGGTRGTSVLLGTVAVTFAMINVVGGYLVTDRMLKKNGIDPKEVNKVTIPQIPVRLEMLQNGQLAAATLACLR